MAAEKEKKREGGDIHAADSVGEVQAMPPPTAAPPDPFDPESLRLSQDFAAGLGVKKTILTIPVRKPSKEAWVRVHPDEGYRFQTAVVELKDDREVYLVDRKLWPDLSTESVFGPRMLFTAVTRQNVVFLWPVRLPGSDGRIDSWNESVLQAATMAMKGWVRVAANMGLGAYDVFEATGSLPEPAWPDLPFRDLLKIAFKGRFIDSMDHPILRRLRGEI